MDVDIFDPALEELLDIERPLARIATGLAFGEGPLWDRRSGSLFFVEIIGDRLRKWAPGVGLSTVLTPTGHANGLTFDHEGRLLVAGWSARTVWRLEKDGSQTVLASHFEGKKLNTPNDIVVKSDGAIYFTDSDGGLFIPGMEGDDTQKYLEFSGVYRLSPDGKDLRAVIVDESFPNGIAFSPDESRLYITDTWKRRIRAYDVRDDGSVTNGRILYELQGDEVGHADGVKVDSLGNLYCTGPAGIHVLDPNGRLLGRIRVPEDCTNMAWGDDDCRSLYITTFRSVFKARTRVAGIAVKQG